MKKKQPKKTFWESELQLKDIIDFLPDATFVIDKKNCVSIWNRVMEELTGVKSIDILGKSDYEYALPFYNSRRPVLIDLVSEPSRAIKKYYPEFKRTQDTIASEVFVPALRKGGAYLWAIAKPLYDPKGNKIGAIESLRDITERKRSEETIRNQKKKLESINKELSSTIKKLQETNREYQEANAQLEAAHRDFIMANDLLRQSEEKFSTAFRLSPVALALSTVAEGKYVEVSDFFYRVSGYSREEVIGHSAFELNIWANPDDRDRVLKKLKEEARILNEEVLFRDKAGLIHTFYFSAEFIQLGNTPYLLSLNVDISERKRAEETIRQQKAELEGVNKKLTSTIKKMEEANTQIIKAQQDLVEANERLRQSEEKFSKAFHLGPIIITISTIQEGCFMEVSDYFLSITEYTREEVIGHTSSEINIWVNPEDRNRIVTTLQKDGVVLDQEIPFQSKSKKVYIMLYFAEVVKIYDAPYIVSVAVDITERKKTEEEKEKLEKQLQQAQKMESIGRLAGGIAHDFNNLLTAILGNTQLCMIDLDGQSTLYANLSVVKKAAESAADLTKQLLAFSRKQIIEPRVIDLNEMIEHMRRMLGRMIGEDIHLFTSPKAAVARIKADPSNIEQIIANLAVNARDAMPNGGTLILETAEVTFDDYYCQSHAYAIPGQYIMLSISDTGSGMTEEVKKHLFEPFFTTKPKGQGTGLGLATVYGAVKQNKGTIEVYSVPDKGTTFKIYFPQVMEEGAALPVEFSMDMLPKGNETILLVEDELLVREFVVGILNRLGYHVLEAISGEVAIIIAETYKGNIDLLLTDVILSGINGKVLADEIKARCPNIKVLFTSGYTENIIAQHGVLEEGINFIGKPYSTSALSRKIREVIEKG